MTQVPIQPFPVRDRLTPFVTRALLAGAGSMDLRGAPLLPRSRADLYTPEDLRDLQEVYGQGVVHAMVRRARGWERRPVLPGPTPESGGARNLRLWEALPGAALRFTDDSLKLGELTYSIWRRRQESADKRAALQALERLAEGSWTATGDQLLAYWLLTPSWKKLAEGKRQDSPMRGLLRRQPVLGLRHGPWAQAAAPDPEILDELLASPTRAWLPWWMAHALGHWRGWEERLWRGDLAVHISRRQLQHGWLMAWLDAIERSGWYDLLPPILDHLRFALAWLEADGVGQDGDPQGQWRGEGSDFEPDLAAVGDCAVARVRRVFPRAREQDRMRAREAWADYLLVGRRIREMMQGARALHPMEREGNHALLVEIYGSDAGLCRPRPRVPDVVLTTLARLEAVGRVIGGRLG